MFVRLLTEEEQIQKLQDYYKNHGLVIIGFNDSQGVNTTSTFFKKGLLEALAAKLKTGQLDPKVINAFSLLMNKTEHIDYFLNSNVNVEEIKRSQVYSAVSAFRKVMRSVGLPEFLGDVAYFYKFIYPIKKEDQNLHLTTTLKEANEPSIIYSSGVNNLMREVKNNPFTIVKDYQNRQVTPNYNYTLKKAQDPKVLGRVIDGIDRNFDHILSINPTTDIFALGAYVPRALQSEGMRVFRNLILEYNEKLEQLCDQYRISYIDTEFIGRRYNKSISNFHISSEGHKRLATEIIDAMYERKFSRSSNQEFEPHIYSVTEHGASNIADAAGRDCERSMQDAESKTDPYEQKIAYDIASEHLAEAKVFHKVYKKMQKK